jgi:hypothetical protein
MHAIGASILTGYTTQFHLNDVANMMSVATAAIARDAIVRESSGVLKRSISRRLRQCAELKRIPFASRVSCDRVACATISVNPESWPLPHQFIMFSEPANHQLYWDTAHGSKISAGCGMRARRWTDGCSVQAVAIARLPFKSALGLPVALYCVHCILHVHASSR